MREVPSFGAWLKRRRKALDLTQEALARLVGCAVVSIRKIEADEQRPSRQTAERHVPDWIPAPRYKPPLNWRRMKEGKSS